MVAWGQAGRETLRHIGRQDLEPDRIRALPRGGNGPGGAGSAMCRSMVRVDPGIPTRTPNKSAGNGSSVRRRATASGDRPGSALSRSRSAASRPDRFPLPRAALELQTLQGPQQVVPQNRPRAGRGCRAGTAHLAACRQAEPLPGLRIGPGISRARLQNQPWHNRLASVARQGQKLCPMGQAPQPGRGISDHGRQTAAVRRSSACGPLPVGRTTPGARRPCSCANEIHAGACAQACSAERCVSRPNSVV